MALGAFFASQDNYTSAVGEYEEALRLEPGNRSAAAELDRARAQLK